MKTIICTTGTSIAGPGNRFTEAEGVAPYRQRIRDRLSREKSENPNDFLSRISAETNSLARMKVEQGDDIVLLTTETQDGQICAEEIKTIIEETFSAKVSIKRIEGLQVHDVDQFKKSGVQNLFDALDKHCIPSGSDKAKKDVILNMTGGFKAVATYLVLYGMLYQVDVVYLYEQSNQLLTLPPAPLQFDWERMQPAVRAFQKLNADHVMDKGAFFDLVPGAGHEDRRWYETLLEEDGQGSVTLSAFGQLVARRLDFGEGDPLADGRNPPPKAGEIRFYKKRFSTQGHDIMRRVGDCGCNNWEGSHSADKARKGIAKLENNRDDWRTMQHCASCTGGGMWRVKW